MLTRRASGVTQTSTTGAKKGPAQLLLPMVLRLSLALLLLGLASCKSEKPIDPKILDEKVKAEKCLTGSGEHELIYNCGIVNLSILRKGFNDLANDVQIKLARAKELEREKAKTRDRWKYYKFEDAGSGRYYSQAIVKSENEVNFDFPYDGSQRASFELRNHPRWGKDLIISLKRGQFLCDAYQNKYVSIRFDGSAVESYRCLQASDGSSNQIAIAGFDALAPRLVSTRKIFISVHVYQEGERTFEFQVKGFDLSKLSP